jgi:TRAP-type C4-dicarboxylate transport system substrate-binding protein
MFQTNKFARSILGIVIVFLCAGPLWSAADNKKTIIFKTATLAPPDSPWHEYLKEVAAGWHTASEGQVTLRIYPGGIAGNEADMIRKIRIGQLHAGAFSIGGLSLIAPEANALAIPMAIDSWQALDRVLAALGPRVQQRLEARGFVLLNWGDAGWARFFVPGADPSIDAVRKAKLFVQSGDDRFVEIWKSAGFNAVPLPYTDMLPALQSGMINAFNSTAILALASQLFAFTPYMIDMPWAPVVGATIVSKRTWMKIPSNLRPKLIEIAQQAGQRLQEKIRRLEEQAVLEMQKRGLTVIKPNDEQLRQWREVMQGAYPKLRGKIIPNDWFDDALRAARNEMTSDGT